MTTEVVFNVEDLTFGQVEFLTDETGYDVADLMKRLQDGGFTGRDLVAVLAVCQYPEDPAAGMDQVRQMKIADIDLQLAAPDEE